VSETLSEVIREKYQLALDAHDHLNVDFDLFDGHLRRIVKRYLDSGGSQDSAVDFVNNLFTSDLLLASGCAAGSDSAWQRFSTLYRKYLYDLGRTLDANGCTAEEVGETVWIDLFLPDRSGDSRIASYDGRCSLATWLRVVVSNRIINDRQKKRFNSGSLDEIPEPPDPSALQSVESHLGRERYELMILDTFRRSFSHLSARERLMLLLRYDQGVQLGEIGQFFGVHQSTITRQLERTVDRLRRDVVSLLSSEYGLGGPAIEECLGVALDTFSRSISILGLVHDCAHEDEHSQRVYPSLPRGKGAGG
jgi:RNA polymerase sigma-70 factor